MTKHEGVKYNCDQCDAEFSEQGNLKRHKLTKHDGIRYDCNQCEARFYDQNTLKKHQLTKHEGVKIDGDGNTRPTNSYSCQICGFKCAKKPNLKSHIKRRHCTDTLSIKELEEMYPEMYKCHDPNVAEDGTKGTTVMQQQQQQQNPAGMKYPGMGGGGLPQGNGGANHFAKQEQVSRWWVYDAPIADFLYRACNSLSHLIFCSRTGQEDKPGLRVNSHCLNPHTWSVPHFSN